MTDLHTIQRAHYEWVERMGWHNKTVLEALALIASEVGEVAVEAGENTEVLAATSKIMASVARAVNLCRTDGGINRERFGEELADIVLRVVDLAEWQGVNLDDTIRRKMIMNEERGTRGRRV